MNPPSQISPSTQLILDEIHKLFDEFNRKMDESEAWWKRRDSEARAARAQRDAAIEPRINISEWIPAGQLDVEVVADDWGGLFEQDSHIPEALDSPERIPGVRVDAVVIPDNWARLFEQSTQTTKECDFVFATEGYIGSVLSGNNQEYDYLDSPLFVNSSNNVTCSARLPTLDAPALLPAVPDNLAGHHIAPVEPNSSTTADLAAPLLAQALSNKEAIAATSATGDPADPAQLVPSFTSMQP
jgi:hypothetical protein